jgi:hypothetical protein
LFWSDFFDQRPKPPYIHPRDARCFDASYWKGKPSYAQECLDFTGFIKSPCLDPDDGDFHFSLLPAPYVGNLAEADVFILLLNPGFSPGDYFGEYERTDFKEALKQNLKQEFSGVQYPFLYLDPRFCWHPGFRWWEAKLRKTLRHVADAQHKGNYLLALKAAPQRIASIELVPYHSRRFAGGKLEAKLESALSAKAWVRDCLIPRALDGELVIVATYKWHLKNHRDHVVSLSRFQALAAPLTPTTKGGRLILAQLLKKKS